MTPDATLPFEIHITTEPFAADREAEFVERCLEHAAKPMIIALTKGRFIRQPMLSKVVFAGSLADVLATTSRLAHALAHQQFAPVRLKIEVPAEHAGRFQNHPPGFEPYFEWHGKVPYTSVDELLGLCEKHRAHLSHNALKNEPGMRFITLREFGTKAAFEQRLFLLTGDLEQGGRTVSKQQAEYCVYDNNTFLDTGWLPQ